MLRKKTLWLSLLILLLLLGTAITLYLLYHFQDDSSIPMEGMVDELSDDTHTHGAVMFIESDIDVLMLGTWQHTADTNWYRVYTTEPAGDDFCWGREWNEGEDIFEEDLQPYGNGWFKWKKTDKEVLEWHMTDNNSASIPFEYKVLTLDEEQMCLYRKEYREKHSFRRCE